MKIWGEIPKVIGAYDKHKKIGKVEKVSGISGKKDVVSISNNAKDYQSAMKAVRETPDIRQEKVNELADKYLAGNYDINGKDIADKVLKSMIDKRV